MDKPTKFTSIAALLRYQQTSLFIGMGIILWTAICLQLFAHDIPCPRCWEDRGIYLIIIQVLLVGMLCGYKEGLSFLLIILFMVIADVITVQQLITHTINVTKDAAFIKGYGAYAIFLGVPLPYWNLIITNLAILDIVSINYFSHRFHISQYYCKTPLLKVLAILWSISPVLVNAYLFGLHII